MVIIWKALIEYVHENVKAGRSVNIRNFGCFSYNIKTELPKIAGRNVSPRAQDLVTHRQERKNIHHLTPVFVVDPKLQMHLVRYKGKEEISPSISQHSIFQKGFRTIYMNPVPVAAAACLGKDVVTDALNTIFLAIQDLIKFDKSIDLAFGFCNVRLTNRNLKVTFLKELSTNIGSAQFEDQMVRQKSPVSTLWKTSYGQSWANSTLGSLVRKPNLTMTSALNEKTQALKVMSLDMSSSGRFWNPRKAQM
jgi:nucleoid DNA-binding protein